MLFLYTQASEVPVWNLPQIHEACIKHDMAASGIFTSQPGLFKNNKPQETLTSQFSFRQALQNKVSAGGKKRRDLFLKPSCFFYLPESVLKQLNAISKVKENCSIHTSGMFMEQNRNLAKKVMASTMIPSDNNSQHELVISHHGDTKHYCPIFPKLCLQFLFHLLS